MLNYRRVDDWQQWINGSMATMTFPQKNLCPGLDDPYSRFLRSGPNLSSAGVPRPTSTGLAVRVTRVTHLNLRVGLNIGSTFAATLW